MLNRQQHTESKLVQAAANGDLATVHALQMADKDLALIARMNKYLVAYQPNLAADRLDDTTIQRLWAKMDEQTLALMSAASGGHIDVVKELLQYDAVEKRHDKDRLYDTCADAEADEYRCQELISIDAALRRAAEAGHIEIVKTLLAYGAKATPKTFYQAISNNNEEMVHVLLEHDTTLANQKNPSAATYKLPLVYAADQGCFKIVAELLQHGARINEKEEGNADPTALLTAAKNNWWLPADKTNSVTTVKMLLDGGADVNAQNYHGETALMIAAENNRVAIVEALLKHGARVDMPDKYGETAFMRAMQKGHTEIANKLSAVLASSKPAENKGFSSPSPSFFPPNVQTPNSTMPTDSRTLTETTGVDRKRKAFFLPPSESTSAHKDKRVEKEPQENEVHSYDVR